MRVRHPSVDFAELDSQSLVSTQSSTWNGASRVSTTASVVRPPESQISSRFQEFKVSPAYVKTLTKDKCALCKMYFARETVRYKVPMHRIHELHQRWAKKVSTNNNANDNTNDNNDESKGDQALSVALAGRRYQSPSFLYTTVRVCTFCSQLFVLLPDELPTANTASTAGSATDLPTEPHKTRSSSDAPKLSLTTQLARTNLALSRTTRTYQSSVVDNKLASYAVLPPYELCARTRREVDPWWEIDLGRTIHAHSLSFKVRINVRQAIHVVVALLKAPVGFENPFLDRIRESAVLFKEFAFAPQDDSRTESVHWELPPHTLCFAVRVQLRGIQTLSLSQFIVLQGDDYVPENKADFETLSRSFAALPVSVVKEGLKEMLSSSLAVSASAPALLNSNNDSIRPRTSNTNSGSVVNNNNKNNKNSPFKASLASSDGMNNNNNNNSTVALRVNTTQGDSRPRTQTHTERVSSLAAQAREQYLSLSLWTERALQAVREIREEEVSALYKVIFKYAADLNPRNATAQHTHAPLSPPLSPHSSHNTHNNVLPAGVLNEHDLLSPHALTQHTPRCELREVHNRLRSVLRWLQTRTHSKTLGGLLQSERLLFVAENTAEETLAHFAHAIACVERHWSLREREEREREEQEKREREIHAQRASLAQSLSLSLTSLMSPAERERERDRHTQTHRLTPKIADRKGCSWTQFLILMDCFCRNDCHSIPSRVFDIASDDASISAVSLSQIQAYTFAMNERDDDIMSQSSLRLTTAAEDSPRRRRTSSYALNTRESTRNPNNTAVNNTTGNSSAQGNRRASGFLTSESNNNNNNNDNQSDNGSGIHYVITSSVRNVMRRNGSPFAREGESSLFSHTYGSNGHHKKKETSFLSGVNKSPVMFFREQQEALKSKKKTLQQEVRESGFNPFDSAYSEFKFDRFKRRTALHDMDFPKELSLEFAATLIPKKAMTSAGASLSHSHNGLRLGGELEQSVFSSDMNAHGHSDDRSAHSGNSDPLLAEYTGMPLPSSRPTLSRANTRRDLSRSKSGRDLLSSSGYLSVKSTATVLAPIMNNNNNKAPFVATVRSSPSKKAGKTARFREEANESFDDFDFDDDFDDENNGDHGDQSKQMKNINFFRVCSLCELRLPRASVEYKVLRKHIVKLRCTWDPKLVSKEVHSLDNSITMYNLVNVCVFCAQFFDPDFPDGIAYPVRIPGTNKPQTSDGTSSSQELIPLSAISSQTQDKPLVPFYDTRYLANDIDAGGVLSRPSTTQARQRAKKVIEIAREIERKKNKDMSLSPSVSSPSEAQRK